MPGINRAFTGSGFDHDHGRYAQWVDHQALLRAAKEAAVERRAQRRAERARRVRGATATRPVVLPHS